MFVEKLYKRAKCLSPSFSPDSPITLVIFTNAYFDLYDISHCKLTSCTLEFHQLRENTRAKN